MMTLQFKTWNDANWYVHTELKIPFNSSVIHYLFVKIQPHLQVPRHLSFQLLPQEPLAL